MSCDTTPASVFTEAARLCSLGLALCKPSRGTKKPTYPGWPTRSLEPEDFAEGDLLGIIGGSLSDCNQPGHALVIVDGDAKEAVEKADDFLPATGMIEGRPSKPRSHRSFLVPLTSIPEWAWSTAVQAAEAARKLKGPPGPFLKHFRHAETGKGVLDFIGTGGQVVCPPSPHPSGELREWEGGEPGQPAVVLFEQLWDAVCVLALKCGCKLPFVHATPAADGHRHNGTGGGGFAATMDADQIERRAIAYLEKIEPAISRQGGHDKTYWPARVVCWGFDLGAERGFRLLSDHFNPRCQPPWSEQELRHKCQDADRLPFSKPRGWLLNDDHYRSNGRAGKAGSDSQPVKDTAAAPGSPATTAEADIHLTDLGNAQRVIQRHGADLYFCHPWKSWLLWDGRRWANDQTAEADSRVKDTQADLYRQTAAAIAALAGIGDDEERKRQLAELTRILKHALAWEDARALKRCLEMMRSEPDVPVLPEALDRDPMLLNVLNGTIDLRTGQLRPHRREDLLTKLAPVVYDPEATCPTWLRVLDRIMDGKQALITYLQRVVGYGMTGDVSEQVLWFFYGHGANGKSTFLATILAMLGDYAMQAVAELLMAKKHEAHPTERADLFGKRLVATIETDQGKSLAESLLKQLTGGDKVRARKMRQDFFEFDPTHKLILAANHKPVVKGTDLAVWRRIKLVPFTVTIPPAQRDKTLLDRLKRELPGILAWSVKGCLDWQACGMEEPEEVRKATEAYQAEQDTLERFLEERCHRIPEAQVKANALFDAYAEWSGDKWTTYRDFNDRLRDKGYQDRHKKSGNWWQGIGLTSPEGDEW